jgi:hypothetical protein
MFLFHVWIDGEFEGITMYHCDFHESYIGEAMKHGHSLD